jgi:hypothetical protein
MTSPTNTTPRPAASGGRPRRDADSSPAADPGRAEENDLDELARTQEETTDRARELVASRVLQAARSTDGDAADRLVLAARRDLLAELRAQEQEEARRQLSAAADSSEDAVAGVVRGVVTIVRGVLPTAVTRPDELIETTYALADQGLRVVRRLALAVTGGVRDVLA